MIRAVIRVGVISRSAAVRAGLRALLDGETMQVQEEASSLTELDARGLEMHSLDVIVTDDLSFDQNSGPVSGTALVLLSDDPGLITRMIQLELSGWALLAPDAPADELQAAVSAAAHGLAALPVGAMDARWLESPTDALLEPPIQPEGLIEDLTAREGDVLELLALGLPNKTIARRLGIGESTVKFHLAAIYAKLGVSSRTAAVSAATRRGLVTI